MNLGNGITEMERGSYVDPEVLESRRRMIRELTESAISTPQQGEMHWMQGAARLAQALMAAYQNKKLKEDESAYGQQQSQEMQKMASYLKGDKNQSIDPLTFRDPNMQKMAMGMMQDNMRYSRDRQDRQSDKVDERGYQEQSESRRRNLDPTNKIKDEIFRLQEAMSDPEASDSIKLQASERLKQYQQNLVQLTPSQTTINVDTTNKATNAGEVKYKEKQAETAAERDNKNIESGLKADENLFMMNQIQKQIEDGSLTNSAAATDVGKTIEKSLAIMGLPNDSAAVSNYIKNANQQLIDARQQFKGQGQVSDSETKILSGTVLQPNDTIESIKSKLFVFKQVYERQKMLGDLTNQWIKRYGSTMSPAENGMTLYDAVSEMYKQNPIASYEQSMKDKADAASQSAYGETNGN